MTRVLMTVVLLLGLAGTAPAEGLYLSAKVGAFEPNHDEKGLQYYHTGFSGELALGWRALRYLALETGVGYAGVSDSGDSVSVIPVLLTGKATLPLLNDKVDLFLGGGLGYYFSTGGGSGETTGLGYHVVLGADYRFTDVFSLGVEIKRNTVEINSRAFGGTTYALVGRFHSDPSPHR